MGRKPTKRLWLKILSPLILGSPALSYACYPASPSNLSVVLGQTANFSVTCDSYCTASVTATSQDGSVSTVTPASQTVGASPRAFTVEGLAAGTTTVSVGWSCSAYGSGGSTVSVTVEAPEPLASGTDGKGNKPHSGFHGDPISTFSGELYQQFEPDLELGGPMNLSFSRYYGAMLDGDGVAATPLGTNWRHNFSWQLSKMSASDIEVLTDHGALISFTDNGGSWEQTTSGVAVYQLIEDGVSGSFTLFDSRANRFYVFSSAGLLTEINDGRGNMLSLSRNASNTLTSISDGLGRTLSLSYFFSGNLIRVSDGPRSVQFDHNGNDLVSVTSVTGDETTYTYASGGLMTAMSKPLGNTPISQQFDGSRRVTSQADADSNTTTLSYDADQVTTITDPLGQTTQHRHTDTGQLTATVDANGDEIVMSYNGSGQRTAISNRLGDETTIEYHSPSGRISSIIHADGASTSYSYTERSTGGFTLYDQTAITLQDGETINRSFDANGNVTDITDQLGGTFSYSYDSMGQWLSLTNPLGGVTNSSYNSDATLASVTSPAGDVTSFSYDARKRPMLTTFSDGATREFTYDEANRLLSSTDENGQVTTFSYDENGNLSSAVSPLGGMTVFAYDDNDRLISVTDPLGGVVTTTYDELGRVATFTDEAGQVSESGYDANGNLVSVTDPSGAIWQISYDREGSKTASTDPLGNTMSFVVDELGRPTRITSPLGHSSSLSWDSVGRLISIADPLGVQTEMSRDAAGQLQAVTIGANSTTYTRNALGQVTSVTDPGGSVWSRAYDTGGRQVSSTDPLGNQSEVIYDNRGRISTVTFPGTAGEVAFTYDAAGNMTSRSYSDGTDLNYTYDASGHITEGDGIDFVFDINGRMTSSNGLDVTYDARGRISSMLLAAGKMVSYAYDANDRLVSVTDWSGATTSFNYDAAGRLIEVARPNGINRTNTYDNDSRLTGFTEGAVAAISLTLDARGQTVSADRTVPELASGDSMPESSNSFDAAAQIAGGTYDELGRVTSLGGSSYTWNLASRLTSWTRNGTTANLAYDGAGLRLSKEMGATIRSYIWSYATTTPSILIEQEDGSDLRYYIRTPAGALLYSIGADDDARRFYHFDEIGNTLFVSDDAGEVVGSYAHTPFGMPLSSTGDIDNPFTWQGEFGAIDDGDGLYYIRARYYDANTGRFLSRDPIERIQPRSSNPYQYAFNNPLLYRDISGRSPIKKDSEVKLPNSELAGVATNLLGQGLDSAPSVGIAAGASVFGNTASLINHLSEDEIDKGKVGEDVAMLAVDGGSIYLTATAATAEAGALTGASIAGPAILIYATARAGISIYEMYWDLQDLEGRLEVEKKLYEIQLRRQAREHAEQVAKMEEEIQQRHEASEQREQQLRDEMRTQEEAELKDQQEGRKALKFLGDLFI